MVRTYLNFIRFPFGNFLGRLFCVYYFLFTGRKKSFPRSSLKVLQKGLLFRGRGCEQRSFSGGRHRIKRLHFLILWMLCCFVFGGKLGTAFSQSASQSSNDDIAQILSHVLKQAPRIKTLALNLEAQKLMNLIELSEFNIQAFVQGFTSEREEPRTTPYNSVKSRVRLDHLGLEVSKKWISGIKTSFNYGISENIISFPSRSQLEYYLPDLSIQLEVDLLADMIHRQGFYKSKKVKQLNAQAQFVYNKEVYAVLVNALVDTLSVLSLKQLKTLEKEICLEVQKQQNKLLRKRIQGTVSLKDYLLSQKEVQICNIELDQLSNIELGYEQRIESAYGLRRAFYEKLNIQNIFKQVKSLFKIYETQESQIDWKRVLDVQAEILNLKVLKNEINQLKAASQPRFIFEFRYGLKGLHSHFTKAQEDIYQSDFDNSYIGFRMDLPPFGRYSGKSREKALYAAGRYRFRSGSVSLFRAFKKEKSFISHTQKDSGQ